MLSYLTAETGFLRAFGNRILLLILMCVLTRTGEASNGVSDAGVAKLSALGVTLSINSAIVAAFGPFVALLILVSLKLEADTLLIGREAVLEDASSLSRNIAPSRWVYLLFASPAASALYMALQVLLKLFPDDVGCEKWTWVQQLTDFSHVGGSPSIYCLGNVTKGNPWVYPPLQNYLNLICVAACCYLTYRIAVDWTKSRGGRSASPAKPPSGK
jgi:hypothetical protein